MRGNRLASEDGPLRDGAKKKKKGMIFVVVVQSKIGLGEKEVTKLDQT